ncbi:hypothetical protein [Hymenobacter sp. BT491]|uniref:hypothetical protein n=1 Tax=Hymenobacter sp. BT491 TaxID=2766779 RepID=UPI001653A75D|nr:hypothetical protein [Hymenobacter sp. BT491]MBC6989684.1 hypothetical protein [Hymenobacter sp. BT491]
MNHALLSACLRARLLSVLRRRPVARLFSWFTLLAMLPLHLSCHNFYRTRSQEVSAPVLTTLAASKVFLVHQGSLIWQLANPRLNSEMLEGTKTELYEPLTKYDQTGAQGTSPRYLLKDKKVVLNLVHVYISEYQEGEGSQIRIPVAAIQRIDLVESDTGKTTASYLLGGLGIAAGVFVLVGIIVALTKSSCPFVYAYDGSQYHFVGEAYGGAIFAPLERDDYMPVPGIQAVGQQYRLKLSNELQERQFTNLAELLVVEHPANTNVLLDQRGGAHTISRPQAAVSAVSAAGLDCSPQLRAPDRNAFLFNEEPANAAPNSLTLTFDKPAQASTAKLVLRAQNSLWLDYLYGEFAKKFGSYYTAWALKEKQLPAAEINRWMLDQGLPLKVYVETKQGWQLVEHIPTVGPLAARDLLIPIDLANVTSSQVRVKLEAGFMFWELDYAALDSSPDQPITLEKCLPQRAIDEKGIDQRDNLAATDGRYLQQLQPGTEVTLSYQTKRAAPAAQTRRTAFLHTRGYYEHIRRYEGLPNLPELYAFRKPGRFVEFSKEKYHEMAQQLHLTAMQR